MRTAGKYIMVVDDNLKNLQLAATILKDEGYLLSLAQDASSALSQIEHLIPDLILLDIMMPGIDGLELCRIIKKNKKLSEIPVIFLTAKNQIRDFCDAFAAGGVDYITKPFIREELLARAKNHIELGLSRKKILDMNRTRDKLYSIIAHDIRSPFSSISFTLNALETGIIKPDSLEFREIIKHLQKTANETSILLDDLLSWTRLQNQDIIIEPKLISIYFTIIDCVQLLQGNADNKKLTVNVDIQENIMAFVDEVSIQTVFRNLIFNAVKFTPEYGRIDITARINNDFVEVSVKDSGVGMSEEQINKVFRQNEHYTTSGTNNEQGSGLGSHIIIDFIDKNLGKLVVNSTPGYGTEILVFLPVLNNKAD